MNANQLMTGAAVGLAAFALYQFTKKPGGAVAKQPAQQQRDAGLQSWMNSLMVPGYFGQGLAGYPAIGGGGFSNYTDLTNYLNRL